MDIFEKIEDVYVYGPLSESDIENIPVPHHIIKENDGYYVGTATHQEQWAGKILVRPEKKEEINGS